MQVGIMISNHTDHHPASMWAQASATQIGELIQIDPSSTSENAVRARREKTRLVLDLTEALEKYFVRARDEELAGIEKDGLGRLSQLCNPTKALMGDAYKTVQSIIGKTMFADHFKLATSTRALKSRIEVDFRSVMDIERSNLSDRNANSSESAAYKKARELHGPHNVHSTIHLYRQEPVGH